MNAQGPDGKFIRVHQPWTFTNWNDGFVNNKGRFVVYRPDYPNAYYEGYALRAHVVYWLTTGSVHPEGTDLHHDNEDKLDDRFENLILLEHGKHTILHCTKPPVLRICKNCGITFSIPKWRLKDPSRGTFCSQKCYQMQPRSVESNWRRSISLKRAYRMGIR